MGEFHGNQYVGDSVTGYSYEQLLRDVSTLAEELGHTPTTGDAEADDRFPSIMTIYRTLNEDWATALREAGVEPSKRQRRSTARDRREEMLRDLQQVSRETVSEQLPTKQYETLGSFASSSIKERFGSWGAACEAAGIECGTRHGTVCMGPRGVRLESRLEWFVAVFLEDCGIEYVVHPEVGHSGFVSDFYLPAEGLWVEANGYTAGDRPNARTFERKQRWYEAEGMDHVVVHSSDELETVLRDRGVSLSQ